MTHTWAIPKISLIASDRFLRAAIRTNTAKRDGRAHRGLAWPWPKGLSAAWDERRL
ncbi:hypothetical protein [Microterricola pindariensis]|uniref:hypothetical protein n=1 Tax=Microterricola pindariensis TaxID=478010 RepID=UPI00137521D3|nr:hypothetical protein [Microterricola pindariensis]